MSEGKQYWSMTEGAFYCLYDKKRTLAFRKAIKNTVKKGDVVVDMGTGTGVLAMFAVDAGAKIVYAVEYDEGNIRTLEQIFKTNGYGEKIVLIKGDVTKINLSQEADVIIGEMIATGLVEELQIPAMNNMLRFLKKGGKVLLDRYEIYIDLVSNKDKFYNRKFKIIRYEFPDKPSMKSVGLSEKINIRSVDFNRKNEDNRIDKRISIVIMKGGIINGIRISGVTRFYDGSSFGESIAYSFPVILPTDDFVVKKGDVFVVNISYEMCKGFEGLDYSICKK
ncbi:MAG: 50S ribosomal protein L11 methyltransferase [Candidatus Moraniibacteriota bacterium]